MIIRWVLFLGIYYGLTSQAVLGQSDILQSIIDGDMFQNTLLFEDSSYLMQQVLHGHYIYDDQSEPEPSLLNYVGLAIQRSRQGYFEQADSLWQKINSDTSYKLSHGANLLLRVWWSIHLVRKKEYDQAQQIFLSLSEDIERLDARHAPLAAYYYDQSGLVMHWLSKNEDAQRRFDRAEDLWRQWNQEFHPWQIDYWNHLGILKTGLGEYGEADEALEKALHLAQQASINTETQQADIYSNLGNLKRFLGDQDQALHNYQRAAEIYHRKKMHIEFATITNNLALIYDAFDSLELATKLYREALQIYRDKIGTNNIAYASILNNLAGVLHFQEDLGNAEINYREASTLFANLLGTENTNYTTILSNLALVLEDQDRPEAGLLLYREAMDIRGRVLGKRHPQYVELMYNLAGLLSHHDPVQALAVYHEANHKQLDLLKYYYGAFDEKTRMEYLDEISAEFEKYYATAVRHQSGNDAQKFTNFHLATKGLASRFSMDMRRQIKDAPVEVQQDFLKWQEMRSQLSSKLILSVAELEKQNIDLEQRIAALEALEKRWTRQLIRQRTNLSYQELKNNILPTELAIDFVRYEDFRSGQWQDTFWYAAIVIDPLLNNPVIIPLTTEDELEAHLEMAPYPIKYDQQRNFFNDKIIKPLVPYLAFKERLFISPTALLHRLPFSAFSTDNGYLMRDFAIQIVPDWNSVMQKSVSSTPQKTAMLIGGLEFSKPPQGHKSSFHNLPGTQNEVKLVSNALHKSGWLVTSFDKDKAKKDQILDHLEKEVGILHIATHGFAFEQSRSVQGPFNLRDRILMSNNPMLRTGLILSNINQYWLQDEKQESCFITAYDIAHLQLQETNLVVLSACATGLGAVHAAEGVFGLPRAFKLAGVKSIIYTLWPIDDSATSKFIQLFYKKWLKKGNIEKAFRKAQKSMAREHDPYYWAGFVLIR